jgi:hypothetical protein
MLFTKMVDMARDPAEVKKDQAELCDATTKIKQPRFPYGLCIRLENESLKKLGLEGLPEVGATVQFTAEARVTSASSQDVESADGKVTQNRCVELQICRMGVPAATAGERSEQESEERQGVMYGDDNDGEDE